MNLKVGIVGLPNAGKSTLFNALLKKSRFAKATEGQAGFAKVANYPFTTIEPNVGVVPVPDERLEALATLVERDEQVKPPLVPAVIEFVDIAGLVKGASEGQGLGNKFLSHIREVNVICHVLRAFPDPSVVHVTGNIDAQRDKDIVTTELILADLETLKKQKVPMQSTEKLIEELNSGKRAADVDIDSTQVRDLHLLTIKPVITILNVSEQQLTDAAFKLETSKLWPNALLLCAKTEAELSSLPREEQEAYLESLGFHASGLDRLTSLAYETLGLISFLTSGVKEVRAWTIKKGTLAPQAAGVIHTDFEKKFIKAEVISYDDLMVVGSRKKAKELGKVRLEGKEYEMKDGDVVEFKIGS